MQEPKPLKIYRNGQFDPIATYKPIVKRKLAGFGNKIDQLFVTGHWSN